MQATFKRFDWDTLPQPVRDFLADVAGGAVIERGGTFFASVLRADPSGDDGWTPEKNRRRCELIDRDIAGAITPDERTELDALTDALRQYVQRVAPLPINGTKRLLQELRSLAAAKRAGVPS